MKLINIIFRNFFFILLSIINLSSCMEHQVGLTDLPEEVSMMIATPYLITADFKATLKQHLTLALINQYSSRVFLSPPSICGMVNTYCKLHGAHHVLETIHSHLDAKPQKLNLINLIAQDVNLNELQDNNGMNILMRVAARGNAENVTLLLAKNIDPNFITPQGQFALKLAANTGYGKVIKRLVKGGADCNAKDNLNQTPLFIASGKNHERGVKILSKQRPHLESKEVHGLTALAIASAEGNTTIVSRLLAAGADKNTQDNDGGTPLWSAAKNNHASVVALLLEHEADRTIPNNLGITPLAIASQRGNTDIEKMLQGAQKK